MILEIILFDIVDSELVELVLARGSTGVSPGLNPSGIPRLDGLGLSSQARSQRKASALD